MSRPEAFLLEADGLVAGYDAASGARALDGISLRVSEGSCLGVVGQTGSGKTTLARVLLRLLDAREGRIRFDGDDWLELGESELRRRRWKMQMVFQDSRAALNPRRTAGETIGEPVRQRFRIGGRERAARVRTLLETVGLAPESAGRYPHEFSGGERQRIAIARALACEPKVLICDEPVSQLDAPVKAEIENLLVDFRKRQGGTLILISHDLPAVARLADRIAVLLAGRVVEEGPADAVLSEARHPLTAMLVAASEPAEPAALETGAGCRFFPWCPVATSECRERAPDLTQEGDGRRVACYHPGSYRAF